MNGKPQDIALQRQHVVTVIASPSEKVEQKIDKPKNHMMNQWYLVTKGILKPEGACYVYLWLHTDYVVQPLVIVVGLNSFFSE